MELWTKRKRSKQPVEIQSERELQNVDKHQIIIMEK